MLYTPQVAQAEIERRLADPHTYPCGSAGLLGLRRGLVNCTCTGCIVPGGATPSSQSTPGWRAGNASQASTPEDLLGALQQPSFGSEPEESPEKTVFSHNVETGDTPSVAGSATRANIRYNAPHPGVPGHSETSPVVLDTPARGKPSHQ